MTRDIPASVRGRLAAAPPCGFGGLLDLLAVVLLRKTQ
jgi:hypothetical protein